MTIHLYKVNCRIRRNRECFGHLSYFTFAQSAHVVTMAVAHVVTMAVIAGAGFEPATPRL